MSGWPQMSTMNGKRPSSSMPPRHYHNNDRYSQLHEIIRFINESWLSVTKDLEHHHNQQYSGNSSNSRSNTKVKYYTKSEDVDPKIIPKDFEPFDLEAFCSKREVQTNARNTNS